jgi:predicted  nucleic acid-binding Zn-ribbon protein
MYANTWGITAGGGIGAQGSPTSPNDNVWQGSWPGGTYQTWTDAGSKASNSLIYNRYNSTGYTLNQSSNWGGTNNPVIDSYYNPANRPPSNSAIHFNCYPATPAGCAKCGVQQFRMIATEPVEDAVSEMNKYLLFVNMEIDSSLADPDDDTLQVFFQNNSTGEYGQMLVIEAALASGQYQIANDAIKDFLPSTSLEVNYKTFFQLYHKYATTDTLFGRDSTDLLALAVRCPATDGPPVYKSRALYNSIFNTVLNNNDDNCAGSGYGLRQGRDQTENLTNVINNSQSKSSRLKRRATDYKIFPNPASDKMFIKGQGDAEQVNVVVVDIYGREMLNRSMMVDSNGSAIQIALNNGVYFVTISNQRGEKYIRKMVVEH